MQRLAESHRLGGDHVHERPTLQPGENRRVDELGTIVRDAPPHTEYHSAAWTAQRLVRGRRHIIGDADRRRIQPHGHEARIVRDVGHQQRADLVCDGTKTFPVDSERVGRGASDDHLGLRFERGFLRRVVVDLLLVVQAIRNEVIELARKVDGRAVGQVPAVCKRHAKHRVAGLEVGNVNRLVGLRAGMRLHICPIRTKELFCTLDRERLGHVDELASAVVALAGITFGVLVRELAALCDQNGLAYVVL